jgi:hypothetical protein
VPIEPEDHMHEPPETTFGNRRGHASRPGTAPQVQLADGRQVALHRARSLAARDRVALAAHYYMSGLREVAAGAAEGCRAWCESFWMD